MKNIRILILLAMTPFLVSCTKIISNPDVQTLNQRAVELMNSGDVKGAIARLESINDLNPNFPQNHYNLGVAYYRNGEFEKSVESLKTAIKLDKNITDAYYTTGLAYQEMAGKQIEMLDKLDKPDNEKQISNKEAEEPANPEEKPLTKPELLALIVENLNNSKDYFAQYINLISNSEEKERISQEIQSIDENIQKYEKIKSED